MADDNCKECYDCRSPFTAFRRKHHCRICGQIFCNKCAGNLIPGERFNQSGWMRVCNLCLAIMEEYDDFDDDGQDHFSVPVSIASAHGHGPISPDSQSRNFMSQHNRRPHYSASITSADIGYDHQSPAYARSPSPSDTLDGPLRKMLNAGTSLFRQRTTSNNMIDFPRPVEVAPAPFRRMVDDDHPPQGDHDGVVDHELAKYMSDDEEEDRTRGSNNLMSFASLMSSSAIKDGIRAGDVEDEENARGRIRRRSVKRRAQTPEIVAVLDASTRERRKSLQSFTRPTRMKTNSLIRQYSLSIGDNMDMITPTLSEAINAPLMSQSGRSQSWHQHVELNAASLQHVRQLLRQSLEDANIPNVEEWAPVMMKLLLQVSDNLYPNIRAGDEIDIRHYVKIKKIPGGSPKDSEYIQGVVCTKNVSHKQMSRSLTNPRIMVLTFPLEYQRIENQFMSLEPVMAQEREYLKRLVARIVDQRPHIVLVERSVSRLALEYLLKAHVTVARNVKASVIEAVARCTQADIIPSLDKLAWEARLGRCGSFRIRTYEHELIPNRRKTYMFFDHCQRELGCTIVLRGADVDTLEKLKQITDLMAFVVYNLKMETFLLRDEFAMVPSLVTTLSNDALPDCTLEHGANGNAEEITPIPDNLSVRIEQAIKPYEDAILSASPFVKFPAPYPLLRMRIDDQKLRELTERRQIYMAKRAQDKAEREQALQGLRMVNTDTIHHLAETVEDIAGNNEVVISDTKKAIEGCKSAEMSIPSAKALAPSQASTRPPSPSPSTAASLTGSQIGGSQVSGIDVNVQTPTENPEENPSLMALVSDDAAANGKDAAEGEAGEIPKGISNIEDIIKSSEEIKQDSDFYLAKKEHALQVRAWQSYITQSADDISPFAHQNIAVLYSNVCSVTSSSCQGPEIQIIEYYRESDRTLGQYLEEMCFSTSFACPSKTCERPMLVHYRVYVHGDARVNVIVDALPTPLPGMENSILMWSVCKICKKSTPVIPMSEETWKYSFGKYLELSFYNNDISCRADICPHNIHRDHIRYFGLKNLAMRFEYEAIQLLEVVAPPIKVTQKPSILMRLKNKDLSTVQGKIASFWNSVSVRVRNFHYELVQPDKVEACRKELVAMNQKVEAERQEMIKLSQTTYMESKPTDTLALNVVRRIMQERVVQWDIDFGELERKYLLNEKDVRRMTASQIMRIFVDKESTEKASTGAQTPIHEVLSGEEKSDKNVALSDAIPVEDKAGNIEGNGKVVEEPASQTETSSINPSVETDLSESGSEAIRSGPESAIQGFRPQALSRIESEKESEQETDIPATPTKSSELSHGQSRIPARIKTVPIEDKTANNSTVSRPGSRSRRSSVDGKTPKIRQRSKAPPNAGAGMKSDVSDADTKSSISKQVESSTRAAKVSAPSAASQQRQGSVSTVTTPRPATRRLPSFKDGVTSGGEGGPERGARNYASKTASSKRREAERSKPEVPSRPSVSRSSTSRRIPSMGTMGRVGTLARHYDRISKEIEKQHRFALVRGRRARPVATTKPIVSVFKNLKDAVKDESDDEDAANDNEDADDEFEVDDDIKRSPPGKGKDAIRNGQTGVPRETSMESYIYDAAAEQKAHGQDPSHVDKAVDKTEELLNEAAAQLTEGQVAEGMTDGPTSEAALRNGSLSESDYSTTGAERSSLMKTISNLWGDRNVADLLPLEYPLLPNEHVFEDSKVIVREDEPGSIIAFTLSSKDYLEKLAAMQVAASPYRDAAIEKAKSYFEVGSEKGADAAAPSGNTTASATAPGDGNDNDEGLQGVTGTHLKYQFQEGSAKLFCKIFFAEQFDSVRRNCGCDESYIESLARCIKWDSVAGGKSGSAFLKTRDDRLVMKELSRPEMHALLKFAPAYFDYMNQAFFTAMPTTLAKIFGFYRIGYKNPATGKSMRLDIIVMENLFYERKCSRIFDLKGSMRNRHVQSTGRENEVLLDENLIEFMNQSPLFIREHSKRMLRASLWNDTLFLAKLNVMDYSLVVGIDDNRHELVVGIIDIIRTFTWDKKLESWVKETAFLGGGGKGEPTIITPRQYKNRFREAMERYFLLVPDVWVSADSIVPPKQLKAKNREETSKATVAAST